MSEQLIQVFFANAPIHLDDQAQAEGEPKLSALDRFAEKINFDGPVPAHCSELGPCWVWTGGNNGGGYGRFWFCGRLVYAHRFSYEFVNGPIPRGLTIDHLCRNHACVRPSHGEPVTHRENCLRGISPVAQHAKKTHCVRGHEFTEGNTYVSPDHKRYCRICRREHDRLRRLGGVR